MLSLQRRRLVRIDDSPTRREVPEPAPTLASFYGLLRELLEFGQSAMHLFYHEEDDCVRVCVWPLAQGGRRHWVESLPMEGAAGRLLIRRVRARLSRQDTSGTRRARWTVVFRGQRYAAQILSPHAWDLRVVFGHELPETLPYVLLPRGIWEAMAERDPRRG